MTEEYIINPRKPFKKRKYRKMLIEYTYFCSECEQSFVILEHMEKYQSEVPCEMCNRMCGRDFATDLATGKDHVRLHDTEIKTVGHLAMRNTETMSNDKKESLNRKHNSYKNKSQEIRTKEEWYEKRRQ